MEWLVENEDNSGISPKDACYYSNCTTYTGCWNCPKNKGLCVVKAGGPTCTSRSCVVYLS